MFSVSHENTQAIRRAFEAGGLTRAMAEVRRRYPTLNDWTAMGLLDRILAGPVEPSPAELGSNSPEQEGSLG